MFGALQQFYFILQSHVLSWRLCQKIHSSTKKQQIKKHPKLFQINFSTVQSQWNWNGRIANANKERERLKYLEETEKEKTFCAYLTEQVRTPRQFLSSPLLLFPPTSLQVQPMVERLVQDISENLSKLTFAWENAYLIIQNCRGSWQVCFVHEY